MPVIAALIAAQPLVQVIEHAGHMCTMEQPQAVARVMQDWLGKA